MDSYPFFNALNDATFHTDEQGVYALVHPQIFNFLIDDLAAPYIKKWPNPPSIAFANGHTCIRVGELRVFAAASYRNDAPNYVPLYPRETSSDHWSIARTLRESIVAAHGVVLDHWIVLTPAGFFIGPTTHAPVYPPSSGTCWASERYDQRAQTWVDLLFGSALWNSEHGPFAIDQLPPMFREWAERALRQYPWATPRPAAPPVTPPTPSLC